MSPPIYEYAGVRYIRLSDLLEHEQQAIAPWLEGQTSPEISGLDPAEIIYADDYLRWKQEQQTGDSRNWD